MLDTLEHRINHQFWFEADNPRNPTHRSVKNPRNLWLNFERAALAEGVEHAERSTRRRRKLVKTDRCARALANLSHLCLLTFVLRLQRNLLLAAVFVLCRAPEIVEHKHPACAKDLQPFLRQPLVAFAQIRHRAVRPIRESQRDENRICIDDLARLRTDRLGKHRHRRRARQELHQVDKVTNLADNSSFTFFSILCPVFLRNATGIHSIQHRKRRVALLEDLFRSLRQRRETSIESDHQPAHRTACRLQHCFKLLIVERQWLLNKHMLVSLERFARQLSVQVVSRTHDDQIHVCVVKHFFRTRNCVRKPKSLANIVRGDSRRGRDRTKLDSLSLEMRQQHGRNVTPRANYSKHNPLLRLAHRRRRTKRNLSRHLDFRIVIEHHAKIRFAQLARDQLVRAVRFGDRKTMRRQTLHIDALLGDELEKTLDIALLGPAHVWQRIVVTSLFVLRIVTTWSIRHRNYEFELATEKRLARYVHAGHADNDHAAFQTRHSRRQLDRLDLA